MEEKMDQENTKTPAYRTSKDEKKEIFIDYIQVGSMNRVRAIIKAIEELKKETNIDVAVGSIYVVEP